MPLKQEERFARAITPLGPDVLVLRRMKFTEQISRPFTIELDLASEDPGLNFTDLLGQIVTVEEHLPRGGTRHYSGYVARFAFAGTEGRLTHYHAILRPWIWFLTKKANCRIFQEMTVPDIVKKVFRDAGFSNFDSRLSATYRTWTYCVQYRETDFAFVNRLLEQEGIYYFFQHLKGKNMLVLGDDHSAHEPAPGYESLPFRPLTEETYGDVERVYDWRIEQEVQPATYSLTSYDFEKPKTALGGKSQVARSHALAEFEVYDYPGDYTVTSDGETYSRARIEELQAAYEIGSGRATARGLACGALFKLEGHPRKDQDREYLVLSTTHELRTAAFESGVDGGEATHECSFTAMDGQTPYRPPRTTPRPRIRGPQTAVVVGKAGEEVWTDKYGRIKVQFHWDREGKKDEDSSCWVRVMSPWAGGGYGTVSLPRIGNEVVVAFEEGDPDRPLVVGSVYNADQMPPFELPGAGIQMGMRSLSSPGGGGYNEITMTDTKGKEKMDIHAQYDMATTVEHDQTQAVKNNRTADVTVDETMSVGANQSLTVGSNQTESVGANQTVDVGGDQAIKVGGSRNLEVAADDSASAGSNRTVKAGADYTAEAGAAFSIKSGADTKIDAGANLSLKAASAMKAAAPTISVDGDGSVKIVCGGSSISMDPGSITISTPMLKLAGNATVDVTGAVVTVTGGMVKVNG